MSFRHRIADFFEYLADLVRPAIKVWPSQPPPQQTDEDFARQQKKSIYDLAEQMAINLREKRRNPEPLSPEDSYQKQLWDLKKTPRSRCRHLKGGEASRWGVDIYGGNKMGWLKDYSVSMHTFIDGKSRIRCTLGCGYEVWSDTPDKELWKSALRMVDSSTNRRSSSEIPYSIILKNGRRKHCDHRPVRF